jgi:hypothetical protein
MIDERERYERAFELFRMPEPSWDRLVDRRDRKRRDQRIAAGVVGIAVFLAAIWIFASSPFDRSATPAVTGPTGPERVGFIGLPPEGATPSAPEQGELVLSLRGRSTTIDAGLFRAWVFADGRLIWDEEDDLPYGANDRTTGLLEQHLTPEGVELLRSELVSTGLFEQDLALLSRRGVVLGMAEVRDGDRVVRVDWSNPDLYPVDRDFLPDDRATLATAEQASALERLDALLTHPASWLPERAWEVSDVRAYVPSSFAVCSSAEDGRIQPSRVLEVLPAPAQDLLRANRTEDPSCSEVTTDEARSLVRILDVAGVDRDQRESWIRLSYAFEPSVPLIPGPIENRVHIFFEPYLPHGEFLECSPCR